MKTISQWKVGIIAICLVVAPPVFTQPLSAAHDEVYHYRETTGKTIKKVEWRLTKGDRFTLTCSSFNEQHVTITEANYDTRSWQMASSNGKTQLKAKRTGRTIAIRGRFKGKPIDKVLKIDDSPWYQATSLSLRDFIASSDTERIFWTIRLKTLGVHKIKAIKKEVNALEDNDNLLRIRLTLPGLLAPFWKSDYWFALPDGVFFRFQGPSGPPGSPITTITRTAG